jgi:hypothetical protein
MPANGELLIRNARIFYRNFRGEEQRYNAQGDRNFCLEIDEDTAVRLRRDGWLVKETKPSDEGDPPALYIQVSVKWGRVHQPRIFLVSTRNGERFRRTLIQEDMVELLDSVEIANVDLVVRPFEWDPGKIKAYLKSMYLTTVEDELENEYAELDVVKITSEADAD